MSSWVTLTWPHSHPKLWADFSFTAPFHNICLYTFLPVYTAGASLSLSLSIHTHTHTYIYMFLTWHLTQNLTQCRFWQSLSWMSNWRINTDKNLSIPEQLFLCCEAVVGDLMKSCAEPGLPSCFPHQQPPPLPSLVVSAEVGRPSDFCTRTFGTSSPGSPHSGLVRKVSI